MQLSTRLGLRRSVEPKPFPRGIEAAGSIGATRDVFAGTLLDAVLLQSLLIPSIAVAWPNASGRLTARAFVLRGVVGTMPPCWTPE